MITDEELIRIGVKKIYQELRIESDKFNALPESNQGKLVDEIMDKMTAEDREDIISSARNLVTDCAYGQHDANWLGFYEFFREELGIIEETNKIESLIEYAKQGGGWFIPCQFVCFASERHSQIHRDDRANAHNINGPAIAYPDGWSVYAVHGIRIPPWIIETPEKITVNDIETQTNTEIKRVMIDQYDKDAAGRYLMDSGAKLIHEDSYGQLYSKEIEGDEAMVMVRVKNSTPEPDGTYKFYFLRCHPELRPLLDNQEYGKRQKMTAHNAVASTEGKYGKEYKPDVET